MSKNFINSLQTSLRDNLLGVVRCNPQLQLLEEWDVVVVRPTTNEENSCKKMCNRHRFALISGGGSGHEPCTAGLTGLGGLDATVAGQIFASPSSISVLQAIRSFPKKTFILLLVLNYTGDRIQFGLAQEQARLEGYEVQTLIIEDDCAFYENADNQLSDQKKSSKVGQRGIAGAYFIFRLANALAQLCPDDQGLSWVLDQLQIASKLISTYSVVLESGSIPGVGFTFEIPKDKCEFGYGVHGELGVKRVPFSPLNSLLDQLLQQLLQSARTKLKHLIRTHWQSKLLPKQKLPVAVLINNLGGCSQFEINCVCNEVGLQLQQGVHSEIELNNEHVVPLEIVWIRSGSFMTSLNAHGISISLFPMLDCQWFEWLKLSERTFFEACAQFGGSLNTDPIRARSAIESQKLYEDELVEFKDEFLNALQAGCKRMIANEQHLNQLDAGTGDCDCGSTMAKMGRLLLQQLQRNQLKASFAQIADVIGNGGVGGTSGAIYSLLCAGASSAVMDWRASNGKVETSQRTYFWSLVVEKAIRIVRKYGRADPGDRTIVDALWPLPEELKNLKNIDSDKERFELIIKIRQAAEHTANMEAKAGRATYAKSRSSNVPDPGAWAAYLLIESFFLPFSCTI